MKIPVREQQTVLESTRAAQARVPGPAVPAYSAAESRALAAAGQQMQQTGEVLWRLGEQQKKLNMANFEATTQQMYKEYMAGLSAANDYQNFAQKYDDFEKSIDTLGKSSLGEGEYDVWRKSQGNLFFRGAQLGTAQETAAKKGAQMQGELEKTLNQYATLASQANTPEAFEIYRQQADLALQQAYAPQDGSMPYINQTQRDKMADDFTRQVGTATLMQDMESDPDKALTHLQNPQMYSFFTPVEREQWINKVKKAIEGAKGTVKEKNINDFLTKFNVLRQNDPTQAQVFYLSILEAPADTQEKYGLTASQLHTAYSYMKDSLEEGDLGVEKQNNFADMQIRYRDMGLDSEGNFKEKSGGVTYEKPTLEQMTLLMQNLQDGLSGGQFGSGNQNKAIGLMKGLRNALAKQIKENEVELAAKGGWFDQTVSEYVQQGVLEKLKQDFGDIEIPDEEVADLYFSVWGQLQKQNMNLNSVERADKTAAKIVLLDTYKNRVEDKYFLTKDGAGAVLTSEGALLNIGTGKTPGALRLQEPNGYQREEINGRAVMVRRDKNNEIIDSYEISPLLVRGF